MIRRGLRQWPHRRRAPCRVRWGWWSQSPQSGQPGKPGQWRWAQDLQAASFNLLPSWNLTTFLFKSQTRTEWCLLLRYITRARISFSLKLDLLHMLNFRFVPDLKRICQNFLLRPCHSFFYFCMLHPRSKEAWGNLKAVQPSRLNHTCPVSHLLVNILVLQDMAVSDSHGKDL